LYVVPSVYVIFDGWMERSHRRQQAPRATLAPAESE